MALFSELRRRRVFRVAVIYGITAWVITEVWSVIAPALFLPEWTLRFIIALLIIGFPVAMILAWVFDIGPGGIQRTAPVETAQEAVRSKRGAFVYGGLMVAAMLVLASLLVYRFYGGPGSEAEETRSIAVLPFDNLSPNDENDYFSDGMSEELLNLLVKIPDLRVAARTSSFAYKGRQVDARTVGRELGVATVLEGSVRWAGEDRIRITAQLIDTDTGYHLWSQSYDKKLEDIFVVQDEIAGAIVNALKIELGAEEPQQAMRQTGRPTGDIQAYELYLKGRHYWKKRGEDKIRKSIDLFQQALGRDPGFARASSALAAAYVLMPLYGGGPREEWLPLAAQAARQALVLDDTLAEAHAVLAEINKGEGNWTDTEAGFFFATSLDPNEPTARQWYSGHLRTVGRLQDALDQALIAYELDPKSPIINANLATVYWALGDDENTLRYARAAEELGLTSSQDGLVGMVHLRRGEYEDASRAFTAATAGVEIPAGSIRDYLDAVRDPQKRPPVIEGLDAMLQGDLVPKGNLLCLFAQLGDLDRAFGVADKIVAEGGEDVSWLWLPEAAEVRRDPRFVGIVRELGLVDYWKQYGWADDCEPGGAGIVCT